MAGIPRPINILVIDDDKLFNRSVEFRLRRAGFLPQTVFDGEAALAALAKSKFDLVVLDLVMPGMTGYDVLREIRKKDAQTPVVVLSLLHQEEDVTRSTELGATKYLAKTSSTFMDDLVKYAEEISTA